MLTNQTQPVGVRRLVWLHLPAGPSPGLSESSASANGEGSTTSTSNLLDSGPVTWSSGADGRSYSVKRARLLDPAALRQSAPER